MSAGSRRDDGISEGTCREEMETSPGPPDAAFLPAWASQFLFAFAAGCIVGAGACSPISNCSYPPSTHSALRRAQARSQASAPNRPLASRTARAPTDPLRATYAFRRTVSSSSVRMVRYSSSEGLPDENNVDLRTPPFHDSEQANHRHQGQRPSTRQSQVDTLHRRHRRQLRYVPSWRDRRERYYQDHLLKQQALCLETSSLGQTATR